jgi:guanylate kinase
MADVGNLYVISAPSGTGKTTLVKSLVESLPLITVSISHTTREKRPAEVHGTNYYFISDDEFKKMIGQQDFLEYATIFTHLYGTSKRWVKQTLNQGIDVILEIDWQGHQQIKSLFEKMISIFILPPSINDLRNRLVNRQQDNANIISQRLSDVKETINHITDYDYVVINDDFSQALHDLKMIVETGRLLRTRQTAKYQTLLQDLQAY